MKILARRQIIAGLSLIALIVILATLAPLLAIEAPGQMSLQNQFEPPSLAHPFGLDQNGSDVFSQVLYGARISLLVAISSVLISVFLGLILGSVSGFIGGWLDLLFMRLIDMLHAFPGFLLALSLVAVLGPSIPNLIIALSATGWTAYARLVRGEVLHLKTREYVLGAVAIGTPASRIVMRHIWPNLLGLLAIQSTFGLAGTVITESGLSFLGLGAPSTTPTWGSLLSAGQRALIEAPHLSLFPGLAIFTLVLGFNLFGNGLRDWLDPS